MSVVVSFRIPRNLKMRMEKFRQINWSDEIRKFLEERVRELELEELLERMRRDASDLPELPEGTVARWIRSDRESH